MENKGNPSEVQKKIIILKQVRAGGDQQSQELQEDPPDSEILEELYLKYYKIRKKLQMLI